VRFFLLLATLAASLSPLASARAQDSYVVHPEWVRRPSPGQFQRLYPKQARGITGQVRAECLIDEEGRFSSCEIVSETPGGLKFGERTLKLAKYFQMKPIDADGQPVAGRKLRLPITWYGELYE
jgi:protein TonB